MAAVIATAVVAGAALLLIESVGPILAIAFWAVAALLFGNWYRTSTTPAQFETEVTIPGAAADGVRVYWTAEGASKHGVQTAPLPVNASN
jgi:hypothetical protein